MLERHFISLGAGVQSTAMLLLAEEGEITPKPEAAIFSDTQWEPQSVYNTLDWLEATVSIPIHRVTSGNLRENSLNGVSASGHRARDGSGFQSMPLFTDGKKMSHRTCTSEYKIKPLERKVRELCGVGYGKRFPVKEQKIVQWVGISWDELTRMRTDPRPYAELRYPLVDMQWTRSKCLTFLQDRYPGMPPPGKSACIACPYHNREGWARIKADPELWADAVDFDEKVRHVGRLVSYVHSSGKPLTEVNLDDPNKDQISFLDECEGMCGL